MAKARHMDSADGYHMLPRGKLANAVTWLERDVPPGLARPGAAGRGLRRLRGGDVAAYRAIFAAVGTDWLWASRLAMPDAALAAHLDDAGVDAFVACEGTRDIGLLELEIAAEAVEVLYFGLVPQAFGQGAGRWLMQEGLAQASARGARRIWLHSCSFDHPGAVRFYRSCGFEPYAQGFEIMDDPRLAGSLPREAAPHVPLLR